MMTEVEQLRAELTELKILLLTSDQYIRYERLPQLVGEVIHEAGSEEIQLVRDRWTYMDPQLGTAGNGYNTISPPAGAASATVLNVTETGKLMAIGMLCSSSDSSGWAGTETVDADLRITVDGGTAVNMPLASGTAPGWDDVHKPWRTYGDPSRASPNFWGVVAGDAFSLPLNFEYETSLKVEIVVNAVTNLAGDTLVWNCYTHRAKLVAA